jgi:hypothetical protein
VAGESEYRAAINSVNNNLKTAPQARYELVENAAKQAGSLGNDARAARQGKQARSPCPSATPPLAHPAPSPAHPRLAAEARLALDAGDEQHAIHATPEALPLNGNSAETRSIRSRASLRRRRVRGSRGRPARSEHRTEHRTEPHRSRPGA